MGDWFSCKCKDIEGYPHGYGITVLSSGDADIDNEDLIKSSEDIWLPRQDQIQEMMFGDFDNPIYISGQFQKFHEHWLWLDFTSMEQLWLAFMMWEKHGKIWEKEKWVKK